jgi:hypothetical protein
MKVTALAHCASAFKSPFMIRLFAQPMAAAYNSGKERHPMKNTTTDKASKAKTSQAAAKVASAKKKRPTTGELLDNLSKYRWNFEAMNSAR